MFDDSTNQFYFTGSYGGAGGGGSLVDLTAASAIVSASVLSSANQGEATLTINGSGSTIDLGLKTGASPTFDGLTTTGNVQLGNGSADTVTIAGNLIVNGSTTTISTSNLAIEDKFMLLASGAAETVSSGIIVEREQGGIGTALFFDASTNMWSVDVSLADADSGTDGSATADVKVVTVGQAAELPTSPLLAVDSAGDPAGASEANARGQLFVDTDDEFGLYVWLGV